MGGSRDPRGGKRNSMYKGGGGSREFELSNWKIQKEIGYAYKHG